MDLATATRFVQEQFTDGLVLVVGSGLSAAEGLPGMPALAQHLTASSTELRGDDSLLWKRIAASLNSGEGLEAALLANAPSESLEGWIVRCTCKLLMPREVEIISEVVRGDRNLKLTNFLARILKSPTGLPILTPNYDRLIEVACEMARYHVDTTAIGTYAASFDHVRSCMASCRGISSRGKTPVLDHFPRAIVLKPHGSFDWYRTSNGVIRSSISLDAERMIITPGLNKYRAGYNSPFDKHRELANDFINRAARLLIIGYGFNDDHLQNHLIARIEQGTPTLILTHTPSAKVAALATNSPNCWCFSCPANGAGLIAQTKGARFEEAGANLWDVEILSEEWLA